MHRHRGSIVTMHALHSEKTRMVGRDARYSHERAAYRRVDHIGKAQHLLLSTCGYHTAAEVDVWTACGIDIIRSLLNAYLLGCLRRLGLCRRLRFIVAACDLNILGYVDEYRSGSAGCRKCKRLAYSVCKLLNSAHKIVVLRYRERNARDVYLLKAVGAYLSRGNVTADSNYRNGIEACGRNPGDKVRRAGTGGGYDYPDLSCGSCITVCGMCRPLLMRREYVIYFLPMCIETVIYIEYLSARISENVSQPCSIKVLTIISAPESRIDITPF